jgi:uncharacterized membrane protein (UPF0136 family)
VSDKATAYVQRLYAMALLAALGGLFFLYVRDLWMTGASLALSVGGALLAWGAEHRRESVRWGGYAAVGVAVALLIIDTLRDYLL